MPYKGVQPSTCSYSKACKFQRAIAASCDLGMLWMAAQCATHEKNAADIRHVYETCDLSVGTFLD